MSKAMSIWMFPWWNESNNPCHPNPTALVGNKLTSGGNVVEVRKVR